jgi:exo-beta-1,3-glucanase (GH17 family)
MRARGRDGLGRSVMQLYAPSPTGSDGADRMTAAVPVAFRTKLLLFVLSLGLIAAAWCWMAWPARVAAIDPVGKLDCVSYAPFRVGQTPWNSSEVIPPEQIAEDLATLSVLSGCIRIYSVENGLDQVPALAAKVGLRVILGVWIGRDPRKNADLIDTAVSLTKHYPETITALFVGSEVLLRGDMTAGDLQKTIRSAKARVSIPVSYADVSEFWLRYPDVGKEVDFVTVHVLPYWEDVPVRAEDAAAHVGGIYKQVAAAFPGKEILIGEAGWPSRGRMRDGALPSRINQARFLSEVFDLARRENIRVNLFEAYDEPWKQQWEGTAGGHWGLLDGLSRELKYPPGSAVGNYPFWKLQLAAGLAFCSCVFAAAWFSRGREPSKTDLAPWVAVAASATVGGCLLGVSVETMLYESYGLAGWSNQGLLLAAAMAAPLFGSHALVSGRPLPGFVELIGPRESRPLSVPALILALILIVTTLLATETALGLVFDPRGRDFPFAGLTMAVLPICAIALLNRRKLDADQVAEATFAGLLVTSALCISLNEGFHNWQALWTSAAYVVLGAALWTPRAAVVWLSTCGSSFPGCPAMRRAPFNRSPSFRAPNRNRRAARRWLRSEGRVKKSSVTRKLRAGAAVQSPEVRPCR